jgi:hypothetical protein
VRGASSAILDEVKSVLPHFWEHYRKCAKVNKTDLLQPAKESDTFKSNPGKFLETVDKITQKKENEIISKPQRAKQLEKATKLEYLQEFIKIGASQQLSDENEEEQTELDNMHSIIESNGDEISNHERWKQPSSTINEVEILYQETTDQLNEGQIE